MTFLKKIHFVLAAQFGFDPRRVLRSAAGIPRYLRDLVRFRRGYGGRLDLLPCLYDWSEESGTTWSEYFWQDLAVARMIFRTNPGKHVDIGSRVDGFIAHVASFREIEVFDVRPATAHVPGVEFRQADFMNPDGGYTGYCDSLSCLHALEHFGLGRYGDPIDPEGFDRGFANMSRLLRDGGRFYLSIPLGKPRVEFNAHRISDPAQVMRLAAENGLVLADFQIIGPRGLQMAFPLDEAKMNDISARTYSLGLFVFVKTA